MTATTARSPPRAASRNSRFAIESSAPAVADSAYAGFSGPSRRCSSPAAASVSAEATARPIRSGPTPLSSGAWCRNTSCSAMAAPAPNASSRALPDGREDRAPGPALTSTTAASASGRPISPAVPSRSPCTSPTATGSIPDTRAVTGDSTFIGPIASVRYSSRNAAADANPEAAPHTSVAGANEAPSSGHRASSTTRLAGAAIITVRSTCALRAPSPPRKSAAPYARELPSARTSANTMTSKI
nr:hypothetical protein [Glycomyces dulcitolivorans]